MPEEPKKLGIAMTAMWLITILSCLAGAIELSAAFSADSAPKQAAGAAMAAGCCIVPYCISRALQAISGR